MSEYEIIGHTYIEGLGWTSLPEHQGEISDHYSVWDEVKTEEVLFLGALCAEELSWIEGLLLFPSKERNNESWAELNKKGWFGACRALEWNHHR